MMEQFNLEELKAIKTLLMRVNLQAPEAKGFVQLSNKIDDVINNYGKKEDI
jgi:hypothetical protein